MINDRKITITAGASRRSTAWNPQTLLLSELYDRLRVPTRSTETLAEYLAMTKPQQDDLKDIGGFVAGSLNGSRRKASAVTGRDVLTLDLDNIPAGGTDDIMRRVEGLGCGYCIYSTRKHQAAAPRLRILLPLDRTVTADEYEPLARKMAEYIGLEFADPTTFEASRLMYWPSCCTDSDYVFLLGDKPMLSADGLLATYSNWRDLTQWPQVPGAQQSPQRLAAKQGDPLSKSGVVGAFCRVYDIYGAMDKFLPHIYEPADGMPGRYTFTGGSTAGGAVIYDEGKFLFSHHATDPCSGKLVNAFDMVRLHLFDDKDNEAAPNTPTNRLPSYTAMCELAVADSSVGALMAKERYEEALATFSDSPETIIPDTNWMSKLSANPQTGTAAKTMDNIWIILENDPMLNGRFALNQFAGRGEVFGELPWKKGEQRRFWEDNDNQGVYWYMEKVYKITGSAKIDGALSLHSSAHSFNDVENYIAGLNWDCIPRLDSLLIDYLGAADTEYTRAVTRKSFTAAVARVMDPGCKYDTMTIFSGAQGLGKSTLLQKMSRGWFNDSIRSFEGKEASELLQGVWLVEISELDAFRRTDVARIKQFLSLRADRFRAAYGRHVKEMPRCCVFFGTTNTGDYLQDKTGNRRFWPIDVGVQEPKKSVFRELDDEIDQLWAEAKMYWQLGEPLYLSGELEQAAKAQQEEHREVSAREGLVLDFLERPVPRDWGRWDLNRRQVYWSGNATGELDLVPRDRVCALEIWCELFDGQKKDMKYGDTQEINAVIAAAPGWEKQAKALKFGYCGAQRGFVQG